jgi:hypothetical protein
MLSCRACLLCLKCAVRKDQEYEVGIKLNGAHQLVYTDVNLMGDNICTIKEKTESLIDASKEVGREVKTEKRKRELMSRH